MSLAASIPRFAFNHLTQALADTPVVVIHGPRQCGKTTLALQAAEHHDYTYYTFDDVTVLTAARGDPEGFCAALPARAILDEVQRVPGIFHALKAIIDRDRQPGRLILTGSSNVLLIPQLADALTGRMEVLRLSPFAQVELACASSGIRFLEALMQGTWNLGVGTRLGDDMIDRVVAGGFPPALMRTTLRRSQEWLVQYVQALIQKDLRDLSRIRGVQIVPKLLEHAAVQTGTLFNASSLAAPFELSRPTIREFLSLLEQLFLFDLVPSWSGNHFNRLVKTPKLHMVDTGLACALRGFDTPGLREDRIALGHLLETFVFQEIRRMTDWSDNRYRLCHYRDKDQLEVDIVVEDPKGRIAGVEVKAGSTVGPADFKGLRRLRDASSDLFVCGVVLYDGERPLPFGDRFWAVPFSALWAAEG